MSILKIKFSKQKSRVHRMSKNDFVDKVQATSQGTSIKSFGSKRIITA